MSDMEDDDYGFDYEDDDAGEDPDVDIENQYYNSKATCETNIKEGLEGLQQVVKMETTQGEWGFKALKRMTKIYFRQGQYGLMMDSYRKLLTYIKSAVTRTYSEKSLNNLLDLVGTGGSQDVLLEFYQVTLAALVEAKNERLWFKTQLKLGNLFFARGEYKQLEKLVGELHKSCQSEDGSDDQKKGTQLREIYALEIQFYSANNNTKKLKDLYGKAQNLKSAISHPRVMGEIQECGGKMYMQERSWDLARGAFGDAFKFYDECGDPRRILTLKYLVLANMLAQSEINPFDSQDTKPYKNDPEITAMTSLLSAYERNDIKEFEKILRNSKRTIMDDPFIASYISDLIFKIRTQVLIKMMAPYTRVRLSFLARELNITEAEVEHLLIPLILDNEIDARIDQRAGLLVLSPKPSRHFAAISAWAGQLSASHNTLQTAKAL
eukprot:TRINITY_DN814_c0_g1_i1.p1 TRINITY_DN814_c0_g1~~TRINITY_DN814_c0_g1_i1.p1  ORF type:complete len:445 (-),score=131.05 TRINITY_DN814_c0_g1_i1:28-1338(-)